MSDDMFTRDEIDAAFENAKPNEPEPDVGAEMQLAAVPEEKKKELARHPTVKILEDRAPQIDKLCGVPGLTAARAIAAFKMHMVREPKLCECCPLSVLDTIMKACAWGVDLSGTANSAWPVPFWNKDAKVHEAKLMIGYGGLIQIAVRRGVAKAIMPDVVYDGDEFDFSLGTERYIRHKPSHRPASAKITHAYAVAYTGVAGVPPQFEVLDRIALDEVFGTVQKPSWQKKWFGEWAKKTAVRRLCKWMSADPVVMAAVSHTFEAEGYQPSFDPDRMRGAGSGAALIEAAEGGE